MLSLARYSTLLGRPELKAAIIASVIGRLPIGITGLSILLLGQQVTGSFGQGGALAAVYVAGLAATAPVLGRLIDRSGPRRILLYCAVAYPAALCAIVYALGRGGVALTLPLSFFAGASVPPINVCMRTFFRQQLGEEALLAAAYSMESVLIETIFIFGPLLVALFIAFASASAAVLFAALCGLSGTLLFLRSPALAHWRIEPRAGASLLGPLGERGFLPLLAVILCYSGAFGLVEIGVTAYAAEMQRPALAGLLLGMMSVGSAGGGLAYGSRSWRLPLSRQFAVTLGLMGMCIGWLALTRELWPFAMLSVLAGVLMAPALTIQAMLVAKTASPKHATEAFTWSSTGLLAGVGAGIAWGGWMVESYGASSTFLAAALTAIGAGALALRLRASA